MASKVTLFADPTCAACNRVHELFTRELQAISSCELDFVECHTYGRVQQCRSLCGGATTLPQVFLNGVHLSSVSSVKELRDRLANIHATRAATPAFPPPADAPIIKISADVAASSQLSLEQLPSIQRSGIQSIINLIHADEPEADVRLATTVSTLGLSFVSLPPVQCPHNPTGMMDGKAWRRLIAAIDAETEAAHADHGPPPHLTLPSAARASPCTTDRGALSSELLAPIARPIGGFKTAEASLSNRRCEMSATRSSYSDSDVHCKIKLYSEQLRPSSTAAGTSFATRKSSEESVVSEGVEDAPWPRLDSDSRTTSIERSQHTIGTETCRSSSSSFSIIDASTRYEVAVDTESDGMSRSSIQMRSAFDTHTRISDHASDGYWRCNSARSGLAGHRNESSKFSATGISVSEAYGAGQPQADASNSSLDCMAESEFSSKVVNIIGNSAPLAAGGAAGPPVPVTVAQRSGGAGAQTAGVAEPEANSLSAQRQLEVVAAASPACPSGELALAPAGDVTGTPVTDSETPNRPNRNAQSLADLSLGVNSSFVALTLPVITCSEPAKKTPGSATVTASGGTPADNDLQVTTNDRVTPAATSRTLLQLPALPVPHNPSHWQDTGLRNPSPMSTSAAAPQQSNCPRDIAARVVSGLKCCAAVVLARHESPALMPQPASPLSRRRRSSIGGLDVVSGSPTRSGSCGVETSSAPAFSFIEPPPTPGGGANRATRTASAAGYRRGTRRTYGCAGSSSSTHAPLGSRFRPPLWHQHQQQQQPCQDPGAHAMDAPQAVHQPSTPASGPSDAPLGETHQALPAMRPWGNPAWMSRCETVTEAPEEGDVVGPSATVALERKAASSSPKPSKPESNTQPGLPPAEAPHVFSVTAGRRISVVSDSGASLSSDDSSTDGGSSVRPWAAIDEDELGGRDPTEIVYTVAWARAVIDAITSSPKPVLVTSATGAAASCIVLLHASLARRQTVTPRQVFKWLRALGHDLESHQDLAIIVDRILA